MSDHADAAEAFAAGPPEVRAASALAGLDASTLANLIETLRARGQRAHLEAIGRSTLPKATRKAAKRAAYALRSAGVAGAAPRAAAVTLAPQVDLEGIALVGPPGLSGRYWIMLAELPDAAPLGVEVAPWGDGTVQVTPLDHLTPATIRRYLRRYEDEQTYRLEPASADLALRALDHVTAEVRARGGDFGAAWHQVLWWCARARELGADAARANARAQLGDEAAQPPLDLQRTSTRLLTLRQAGPHTPPEPAVEALLAQVGAAAEARLELSRAQFEDRLLGLADAACDAFFASAEVMTRAARALDATADVLLHAGFRDEAVQALWLSDQLAAGSVLPHELGFVAGVFRRLINVDAAWAYHEQRVGASAPT